MSVFGLTLELMKAMGNGPKAPCMSPKTDILVSESSVNELPKARIKLAQLHHELSYSLCCYFINATSHTSISAMEGGRRLEEQRGCLN